ncbi:MAG TPA: putative lipid II flippase FtsW [Jatrophihabitans sp.]
MQRGEAVVMSTLRARVGGNRVWRASGKYLETPYASVQLMIAAGGGLLFFGLLMSASTTISASQHTTGNAMWSQLIREIAFLAIGVPVFWLAVRMPPVVYRRLVYPTLALALMALVGVLVPGIGVTINSAHRWIQLGPLTIQPSEFAKLAVLLWGADLLARKESLKTLTSAKHVLVPLVPGFVAVIALVMLEPDLGTTLCFLLLLLGLLWMVGLPFRYFTFVFTVMVGAVTALAVAEPYRLQRITTFLHPNADAGNTGFQTLHGLQALASGGLFGVGLGRGTLKYGWVPNANTDYVFSVVGEELGLLGSFVVLGLFGLFTYSAIRIAGRCNDPFVRLVASGTAIWFAGQALINIGYVTALLPVTGIPLPFISNGGTSLVLTCGVFGMLVSFARHEPAAVKAAQRAVRNGTVVWWVRALRLGTPKPIQRASRSAGRTADDSPVSKQNPSKQNPSKQNPANQNQPKQNQPKQNQPKQTPRPTHARAATTTSARPAKPAAAGQRRVAAPPPNPRLRPTGTESSGRRG